MAERPQLWQLVHRSHGSGLLDIFSSKSDSEVDSEVSYKLFEVVLTVTGFDRQMPAYVTYLTSNDHLSMATRMQVLSLQRTNPSKKECPAGITFLLPGSSLQQSQGRNSQQDFSAGLQIC